MSSIGNAKHHICNRPTVAAPQNYPLLTIQTFKDVHPIIKKGAIKNTGMLDHVKPLNRNNYIGPNCTNPVPRSFFIVLNTNSYYGVNCIYS